MHSCPIRCKRLCASFCDAAAVSSFGIYQELLLHPKIYGAFGCHPRNAASWTAQFHERVVNALQHEKARAWGECGLDFVVASNRDVQIACFREQALRAVELGFPLVVHSRGAPDETFQVLTECCPPTHKIHVHCFDGDVAEAERLFAHFSNLWIGFTGSITHHNAHGERIREVVHCCAARACFIGNRRALFETGRRHCRL
jgi:TatD DNase family protein